MADRHVRPEEKFLLEYRKACPKHAVTFELLIHEDTKRHLFALNDRVRRIGNEVTIALQKRIDQMRRTKAYRKLRKDVDWKTEHMKELSPEMAEYQGLDEGRRKTEEALSAMQRDFGTTRGEVQQLMRKKAQACSIPPLSLPPHGETTYGEKSKRSSLPGLWLFLFRRVGISPSCRQGISEKAFY